MELDEALIILELSNYNKKDITLSKIKKQYHKLALLHHPDKNNNTNESCEKFQDIQRAYELVKDELIIIGDEEKDNEGPSSNDGYYDILHIFISNVIGEHNTVFIMKMMKEITFDYKNKSLDKMFEGVDKDTAGIIYNFILKYKALLHIDDETLEYDFGKD